MTSTAIVSQPPEAGAEPVVYRIDGDDTIVFVNDAWGAFAVANGAPALAGGTIGRSLWDFVAGTETAMLWREVIARVRAGRSLALPYRCDAPERRRTNVMQLTPLASGGVEFVSTPSRTEDRDPVALLASQYGGGLPLRCCSWCRKFDAGGFVEVEEAIARLGLLEQEQRPITHTICEDCSAALLATIQ